MRQYYTLLLFCLLILNIIESRCQTEPTSLIGAWETHRGSNRIVMICTEKFFSAAVYDLANKKYEGTCGGSYELVDSKFVEIHEFNTMTPDLIGKKIETLVELAQGKLLFREGDSTQTWKRIDDGKSGALAGAWLITGRKEGDNVVQITPGARRTMKILSGTRFQWIAYNIETKEFFGTGGGVYVVDGGKYIEKIEFFSRDNTRVGNMLMFNFEMIDGKWHHSRLSSKGDPIDEFWTNREKIGL